MSNFFGQRAFYSAVVCFAHWVTQLTGRAARWTYATAPWCKVITRAQTDVFTAANVVQSERCCHDVVFAFSPQLLDGQWRRLQRGIWLVSNSVRQWGVRSKVQLCASRVGNEVPQFVLHAGPKPLHRGAR